MLALGTSLMAAEALVAARKGGIDLKALRDVIGGGGANSVMFQRLAAYVIEGDDTQLRFAIANATKDLRYFTHMAEGLPMATPAAQTVYQTFLAANNSGHGDWFVPKIVDVLTKANEKRG